MVSSRPRTIVPIIGETTTQAAEPMAYQPSGVIVVLRITTVTGGVGLLGSDCPKVGENRPITIAAANKAVFKAPRIDALTLPRPGPKHSTQSLVGHHARMVHGLDAVGASGAG